MNKKKTGSTLAGLLLGLLVGGGAGVYIGTLLFALLRDDMALPEYLLSLGGLLLGMTLSWYVQLVLHEGGHLVFGLLSGYRFSSFRIGSLMWMREGDRLRLRRFSLAGTGGQCLMAPPDWSEKFPYVLYNLGGVLMNLITALLFWLISLLCPRLFWLWALLRTAAALGVAMALLNGVPLRIGAADNDGRNVLSISRSREARRAFWLQMKLNEQSSLGVRLRDMPAEWFELPPEEALDNPIVASVAVFRCNRLMDEHRFEEAAALMERVCALPAVPGVYDGMLCGDRLFCELLGQRRRETLDALNSRGQQKFMKAMKTNPSVLRTEYALSLLEEGDAEKAERLRAEFENAAANYPYPQDVQAERELLARADEAAALCT